MRKKYFLGLIFILLITNIFLVNPHQNQIKINEQVYEELEDNEEVRVVVKLKESIKENQDIINEIGEENFKHIFDETIIVEVSKNELNKLNDNPDVESIKIDKPIIIFLQDSVPLINATQTWAKQVSEINITGTDETICVIDTGIDFTHPDLIGKNKTCVVDCINGCVENCSLGDDNGHGTHVAGIISANGLINGVAINSDLIGVKVLNASGSGYDSDMHAGIQWCVDNAQIYNISIISMSLGTDCNDYPEYCYNNYCDTDEIETSSLINSVIQNNISVIISSGNDYNSTAISSPACIQNATAVATSDKDDNFWDGSNRNSLIDLLASGTSINSTKSGGGYTTKTGTSMAAPHVAGAFALIRQFFRLQNSRIPTPFEIQDALKDNGKQIYDSSSNLSFLRIDIYSTILFLENSTTDCTPNWTQVLTDCQQDNSKIAWFNDTNDCYAQTNLSSDLENKPNNITHLFSCDFDSDGFVGNISDINTSISNLFFINQSELMQFRQGNNTILEFEFNLSQAFLNLANMSILEQLNQSNFSYMLIKGLDLTSQNKTKTIYFDRILNGTGICIKDAEINSVDDISLTCTSTNEVWLTCPGSTSNYNCTLANNDTQYKLTGLSHSGVKEQSTYCGDGISNGGETCSSCPVDVGACQLSSNNGGSGGGGSSSITIKKNVTELNKTITQPNIPIIAHDDKQEESNETIDNEQNTNSFLTGITGLAIEKSKANKKTSIGFLLTIIFSITGIVIYKFKPKKLKKIQKKTKKKVKETN